MKDKYLACAHQHFGLWAVEPKWLSMTFALFQAGQLPMQARIDDEVGQGEGGPSYTLHGSGIAVIPIMGKMTKGESSFGGTSSVRTRKAIREAMADDRVKAVVLHIDSPGGTVSGTMELASEVKRADAYKPVYAYIEDLGASAAYWVASQARSISTNAVGEVGSIGVFGVIEDSSGRAERLGIKVHVISTGDFKGDVVPGAPVSEATIAHAQEQVDQINGYFMQDISQGRRMDLEDVKKLADGRTFIGDKAKSLGLVDEVEEMDELMARIDAEIQASQTKRGRSVAIERRRLSL